MSLQLLCGGNQSGAGNCTQVNDVNQLPQRVQGQTKHACWRVDISMRMKHRAHGFEKRTVQDGLLDAYEARSHALPRLG